MTKTLLDYADEIKRRLATIAPQNYLLCGLTEDGELITDEAFDSATRFAPEGMATQATFRGDTSPEGVEDRLAHFVSWQ